MLSNLNQDCFIMLSLQSSCGDSAVTVQREAMSRWSKCTTFPQNRFRFICLHLLECLVCASSVWQQYQANSKCICLCFTQNQYRHTHHCRGSAWTVRRLDCPHTPEDAWFVSCWRRTATQWCPLAFTPMDSASSTWTTLKCLRHRQTHTHLLGKHKSHACVSPHCSKWVEAVRRSCQWYINNCMCLCSRRRSSSLGSCDDEKEELTSAQLTKRIHVLKKKIHRFEEKFEEERKYRVSSNNPSINPIGRRLKHCKQ